ncbi:MAG: MATE family efflux transporter, partial [Myxococcota bacterium]|nr:MATE family efflux transporter [Myxococcota bacterium]
MNEASPPGNPTPVRSLAVEVFDLAWPAILQGLVVSLVFFTDRLLLGRYGAPELASMNVSGPILWSLFMVFGAYGAGAVAVIG